MSSQPQTHVVESQTQLRLFFLILFPIYIAAVAPTLYWLDSSEFATAAFLLGVAHSPGHPLVSLIGKWFTFLPVGSVAFRVGVGSAFLGALAAVRVVQISQLVQELLRRHHLLAERTRLSEFAPYWAGAVYALSYAAAFQSVRPEVYALSAWLGFSVCVELLRLYLGHGSANWFRVALFGGLALSNHHFLALVLALPIAGALALYLWREKLPWRGTHLSAIGLGLLAGLSLFCYLPLRALRLSTSNWGNPANIDRWWWTVSAKAFQNATRRASIGDVPDVIFSFSEQLTWPGAILALFGIYLLLRRRGTGLVGMVFAGVIVLDLGALALIGFDIANPDAYGYMTIPLGLAAIAAAVALAYCCQWSRLVRSWDWLLTSVAVGWCGLVLLHGWSQFSLTREDAAQQAVQKWLEPAPTRALLVTSYFQTAFAFDYLRTIEGVRPDLTWIHRHFLTYPGYHQLTQRRAPECVQLLGTRDVLFSVALKAPSYIEYDIDLPDVAVPYSSTLLGYTPIFQKQGELEPHLDMQTRRFAGWQAFLELHRACRLKQPPERDLLAAAQLLLGGDENALLLRAGCAAFSENGIMLK